MSRGSASVANNEVISGQKGSAREMCTVLAPSKKV
jgi:hypothetical protein